MLNITVSITFNFIFANVNYIRHLWYYAVIEVKAKADKFVIRVRHAWSWTITPPMCLLKYICRM